MIGGGRDAVSEIPDDRADVSRHHVVDAALIERWPNVWLPLFRQSEVVEKGNFGEERALCEFAGKGNELAGVKCPEVVVGDCGNTAASPELIACNIIE